MHADSLVQGVRRVDEQGEELLALRTFSGPEPSRRIEVAMTALVDLAELLVASAPLPLHIERDLTAFADGGHRTAADSPETAAGQTADDAVIRRLLTASYEQGPPTVDQLDAATADRVAADQRIETVDSWVIIPLSASGPYAHNWWPVVELLLDRLDDTVDSFRQLARRARVENTDDPFAAACERVVNMLETFSAVVQRADANSRYVRDRTDHQQDELLSKIEETTTQLRSDDNA